MNEIKTLTGLRGVAAITVMLGHFLNDDAYFRDYLPSLVKRSYLGVDVFFILSGFVLALRYGDKFKESFSFAALKDFLIKRFARIYPLYFVITIIFSMKYLYNFSGDSVFRGYHLPDFIACLLMIQAWGFGFFCVAGATWSLSTECFAYLIFPALAFLTLNRAVYALIMLSASIILVTLVATSPLGVTGKMDVVASSSSLPVARCLAGFCLGLLTYRICQLDAVQRRFSSSSVLAIVVSALILFSQLQITDLCIYLFFAPLVGMLYLNSPLAKLLFANRSIHYLGEISYSLYLAHPLFMPIKIRSQPLLDQAIGSASHASHYVVLIIAVGATILFSIMLYKLVEMPGRRFFSQFSTRKAVLFPVAH